MTKPISKTGITRAYNTRGMCEDDILYRMKLEEGMRGKEHPCSSSHFDRWMARHCSIWESGLTQRLIDGKEKRSKDVWKIIFKELIEFKKWAAGAFK